MLRSADESLDTWRSGGRKSKHICEVHIERQEHSILFNGIRSVFFIRLARESHVNDRDRIMSLLSQDDSLLRRKILVEKKPHDARTISLLARPAAY